MKTYKGILLLLFVIYIVIIISTYHKPITSINEYSDYEGEKVVLEEGMYYVGQDIEPDIYIIHNASSSDSFMNKLRIPPDNYINNVILNNNEPLQVEGKITLTPTNKEATIYKGQNEDGVYINKEAATYSFELLNPENSIRITVNEEVYELDKGNTSETIEVEANDYIEITYYAINSEELEVKEV